MNLKMILYSMILALLFLLAVLLLVWLFRRRKSRLRVSRMGMPQKVKILNELAQPFGFFYDPREDVFTSHGDAWQRNFGYEALFDRMAAGANMVIDAWPVYFDYGGRTWLVEFWKGQYGINTGGEVGIYHADTLVPPHLYRKAHFDAAADEELPWIRCRLTRGPREIYTLEKYHWWLTGFRMGMFSRPCELTLTASVRFREPEMARAFFRALEQSGRPRENYHMYQNEVHVKMDFSEKPALLRRIHCRVIQGCNRFYCGLFGMVTRPFTGTADRMLFLYYQVPFAFRRMLGKKRCRCPRRGRGRRGHGMS